MPRRRAALVPLIAATAALFAGCGTRAPTVAPAAAPAPTPPRPTLASEQRRLGALFEGTPVVFAMQRDGSLRVTVPLRYCFDRGATRVKPPLGAVLDRIARSQSGGSSRLRVSAPPDAEPRSAALARERALSTRDYLVAHGIAIARLQSAGALQSDVVEIVVDDAPLS